MIGQFQDYIYIPEELAIAIIENSFFKILSTNPTKWSNKLKQFVGNLATNCLSAFDHSVGLALKGFRLLKICEKNLTEFKFNLTSPSVHKMVKHTLKILLQILQDF